MSCDMCVLKLLTKEELVKFIQKVGHHQAARIIEEHEVDGNKILELSKRDLISWRLTEVEEELLWKCIQHLQLNHITTNDCKQLPNRRRWRIYSIYNKYFKYKPDKKKNEQRRTSYDTVYYAEYLLNSEISVQKNMNTISSVSYSPVNDGKYDILTNCEDLYLDLNVVDNNNLGQQKHLSDVYEIPPVISTMNMNSPESKKKSKGFKWVINLCCTKCVIKCVAEI